MREKIPIVRTIKMNEWTEVAIPKIVCKLRGSCKKTANCDNVRIILKQLKI